MMLTFRCTGALLRCVCAVRAERHQPPHDGGLAGAGIPHDDGTAPLAAARLPEHLLQAHKEPVSANEWRLRRDARHFEQQWFEHNVSLFEWHQSPWRAKEREGEKSCATCVFLLRHAISACLLCIGS